MISAKQFITLLDENGLLPPAVIESLRKQIEESPTPITAALVAKRVVDAGLLSRLLVQRLLDKAENLPERPIGPAHTGLGLFEVGAEEPGARGAGARKGKPAPVVPPEELEQAPPRGGAPLVPMDEVQVDETSANRTGGAALPRSKPVVPPEEIQQMPLAPTGEIEEIGLLEDAESKPKPKEVEPSTPAAQRETPRPQPPAPGEEIGLLEEESPKPKWLTQAPPDPPLAPREVPKPQTPISGLVAPEAGLAPAPMPQRVSPGAKPDVAAPREAPGKAAPGRGTPARQSPSRGTPQKGIPSKGTPSRETPARETPSKPAVSAPPSGQGVSPRPAKRSPSHAAPSLEGPLSLDAPSPAIRASGALAARVASESAREERVSTAEESKMGQGEGKPTQPRVPENVWDSPLLLIGGGALLLLMILAGVLLWWFTRQSGDVLFDLAEKDYQAGAYTQAIFKYSQYLEKFPKHPSAGTARVNRGLARMRQAADGAADWSKALEVAREVLQEISAEPKFATARPELAAMLPTIAEGLAVQAKKDLSAAGPLVEQAQQALELIDKYVPKSAQQASRLADIEASLAMTSRSIARGGELVKAIEAIKKSAAEGQVAAAYQIRNALVKRDPALADNTLLLEAVTAVAKSEQALVKMERKPVQARTADAAEPILATVIPVQRTAHGTLPDAKGQVIGVLGEGAAYGLDAASGRVLWRRAIGYSASARSLACAPLPVPPDGSDMLLVDFARNELVRLEASTGRLRWRHAVGQRFDAHPVWAGARLVVATRSGRMLLVDRESGESPGYVQVPQELRVAPAVDAKQALAYQLGEHSNLYVVDLAKGTCSEVVYVGHEPGSATVSPALVSRYLFLPLNDGAEESSVRVYAVLEPDEAQKKGSALSLLQTIRLKGHVDTAPLVNENRVLITTDRGEVHILEIRPGEPKLPVAEVAQRRAAGEENMIRFPLLLGARLWIGDSQLTAYNFHVSRGQLDPKWVADEESVSLQPLATAGQAVIHVRRRVGAAGLIVSAVSMDEGRAVWETWLGAPPATEPMVDAQSGRITEVTSIGAVFQVSRENVKGGTILDPPAAALAPASLKGAVDCVVPLDKGLLAMAMIGTDAKAFHVFNPAEKGSIQTHALPDPLGGRLAAFRDGVLAPTVAGQLLCLDPRTGRSLMEPFQPRLQSDVQFDWDEPAVTEEKQILASDGLKRLYRIGVKAEPRVHLAALSQAHIPSPLASSIAALGRTGFAVDSDATLLAFSLSDLALGEKWPLGGNCLWGPRRIGDRVMLATEDQLYCLDAAAKLLWKTRLPAGPLAGPPLENAGAYWLASASGLVWRADPATGKELARTEIRQPLATGPVLFGADLLVGAPDGSLYQIKRP